MTGPLAGLAIHTLFRGHARQLVQWCNFHLGAGAERLYVALDCPPPDFVAALPEDPRIEWRVIDQAAWDALYPPGGANFERKLQDSFRVSARLAGAAGFGHLAFIDVDELLLLQEPFAGIVAGLPDASAITVPVREMWFADGDDLSEPFGATLGLRRSSPRAINWRKAVGWRAQFLRDGLFGHQAGKSIYRLPLLGGAIGSHRPTSGPLKAAAVELGPERGALLHFDSGSFAYWNEKWGLRLEGSTVAVKVGAQRRAQEALFANVLRREPADQERFFREFYSASPELEQQLAERDIATRIRVGDRLSAPLPVPSAGVDAPRRLPPIGDRVDFQFALVCDQRFVRPTFATMLSVLSQMGRLGSIRFVVLGDGLRPSDVRWLRRLDGAELEGGHIVEVVVHDITSDLDRDVGTEDQKRATFGRIYLVDYLPAQRTLYLDGDVLATRPFPELFSMDLDGAALAGVSDSSALRIVADPAGVPLQQRSRLTGITQGDPPDYLNGGVLIFDLDNPDFFDRAMRARALVVLQGHALQQRDQDALNLAFHGSKHRLPSTYNYMTQFYVSERALSGELLRRKYDHADATLVHFSGKKKPWETQDDEFYNGLYRRLVTAAEEHVGVGCDFYFSTRPQSPARRTADEWAELVAPDDTVAAPDARDDVEVVDVCDRGLYLRIASDTYRHGVAQGLRLIGRVGDDDVLFEVDLGRLSAPSNHLARRVGTGIRFLPVDLADALTRSGGVARGLQLALGHADGVADRFVAAVDLVAAGAAATSGLLPEIRADGALVELHDGWLRGRCTTAARDAAVSLFIDGELVAQRVPAAKEGERRFAFNLTRLLGVGYGGPASPYDVAVRVAGTNVPLDGAPLSVADPTAHLRRDPSTGEWVVVEPERPSPARRARSAVSKVKRRIRG